MVEASLGLHSFKHVLPERVVHLFMTNESKSNSVRAVL